MKGPSCAALEARRSAGVTPSTWAPSPPRRASAYRGPSPARRASSPDQAGIEPGAVSVWSYGVGARPGSVGGAAPARGVRPPTTSLMAGTASHETALGGTDGAPRPAAL